MRSFLPSVALVTAAFLLGCQEQGSELVGLDGLGPEFKLDCDLKPADHPCKGGAGGGGDGDLMFNVTITTCLELVAGNDPARACKTLGSVWTEDDGDMGKDGAQTIQGVGSNWLHVFDTGGNGTRGRPKYPGAFSTKIFLQPASVASCKNQDGDDIANDDLLFGKLDQTSFLNRVFDFQVGYDIADNPRGFSIFLFRWKDGDKIFSASTGFGFSGSNPAPRIDFLGDPDDITKADITRVFRISGAKVIAQELDKNKVIAMVACDNKHMIEVTVAPI